MLITGLCIVALLYLLYKWTQSEEIQIPGPKPWPLLGSVLDMDIKEPHRSFTELQEKYGNVMKVRTFREDIVVITGRNVIHEAMFTQKKDFAERPSVFRTKLYSLNFSDVIFSDHTQTTKNMRKCMFSGVQQHDLKSIQCITNHILKGLVEVFSLSEQRPLDPEESVYRSTMQILSAIILGCELENTNPLFEAVKAMDTVVLKYLSSTGPAALLDSFPWLWLFGNQTYNAIQHGVELNRKVFLLCTKEVENRPLNESWLKKVLHEAKTENKYKFSEDNLVMMITNIFLAGTSTTTATVCHCINILAHFPLIQDKIFMEISNESTPSLDRKDEMPYTNAFLLELLRFTSIVPLPAHKTLKETHVSGCKIPKGTTVLINLWGQHHNAKNFSEPSTFNPGRFLTEDGKLISVAEYPRNQLFPFGLGPRSCIGEVLAMTRIFLFIVNIVGKFEILPETTIDEQPSCYPKNFQFGAILTQKPFKVRFMER